MTNPKKTERWAFRVTEESDSMVDKASTLAGVSKTDFVVESATERARTVIAEFQSIELSESEFKQFYASLDETPKAIPELIELFSESGASAET